MIFWKQGAVAPFGMQADPRSIPLSGTFFSENVVVQPFFLFGLIKKSSCHLKAKKCTLTNGKLLPGGLPRKSVVRITDHPNMTSAVY